MNHQLNQSRFQSLMNGLFVTLFFIILICQLCWFSILKHQEAQVSERLAVLRLDEETKHELQIEKEKLVEKIRANVTIENGKLGRIKKACRTFHSLNEFLVRSGDHFVLNEYSLFKNGIGLVFYVPTGKHKLKFWLTEQDMTGSGAFARTDTYGESIYKTLDLPANSALRLTFRLENNEDNCDAIVELRDDQESLLFEQAYQYEKRTLSGTLPGSMAGVDVFRPGQIFRYGGTERYRSVIYKISARPNSIHCLSFRYEICSPEVPIFLRANDVYNELQNASNRGRDFESSFEEDDGSGRFFKKSM